MATAAAVAGAIGIAAKGTAAAVIAGAINGAIIGAVIGGIGAAITGGDILQGVLIGGIGGAVIGGAGAFFSSTGGAVTSAAQGAAESVNIGGGVGPVGGGAEAIAAGAPASSSSSGLGGILGQSGGEVIAGGLQTAMQGLMTPEEPSLQDQTDAKLQLIEAEKNAQVAISNAAPRSQQLASTLAQIKHDQWKTQEAWQREDTAKAKIAATAANIGRKKRMGEGQATGGVLGKDQEELV